jgi:serine phosphatase RsbU (regulator of sigma subunit)
MHLAKKIQVALVPDRAELEGCEVAATMRPAEQVGGDYYDLVRVGDVDWILIGDVSGHGVPAGLIMMMCQTAVRAILTKQSDISPVELLTLVNRTLTANIKRLGENKYMTIQALRRDPDGAFTHAGLHQDLLVYRAATKKVEVIKSNGMWLGIVDDVGGMLATNRFALDRHDVLLLFTDGITEAKHEGKMLDNDGLAKLLEAHGEKTSSEIVEQILIELAAYETDDDVSLVVVKEGQKAPSHSAQRN